MTARTSRRCAYCGRPCEGVACYGHRDLPERDPVFTLARDDDGGELAARVRDAHRAAATSKAR